MHVHQNKFKPWTYAAIALVGVWLFWGVFKLLLNLATVLIVLAVVVMLVLLGLRVWQLFRNKQL